MSTLRNSRPSAAQLEALLGWIDAHRKGAWRADLLLAWNVAGQGVAGYSPALQQLRNEFGPDWLVRQSRHSVERMLDSSTVKEK